jgi:hypothetical protein
MSDQSQSTSAPIRDLSRYTEGTRRQLYDLIIKIQFTQSSPDEATSPEDSWVPTYTPDEAGLTVFYAFGRWFATWISNSTNFIFLNARRSN